MWPALFALIAAATRGAWSREWIAAVVALMMLAGFAYTASVVMLGVAGAGAIVLVVLDVDAGMVVWRRSSRVCSATGASHWA